MALPDAMQNETGRVVTITWNKKETNSTAETLTGFTITGVIEDLSDESTRAISGALAVSDGASGQFTWTYDTTDTGTAGDYSVHFVATSGATVLETFPTSWQVVEAPTVS